MSAEQLVANYTPVGDGISILTCLVLLIIVARVLYFSKDVKFLFLQRALHFIVLGSAANIVFFIVAKQFSEHVTLLIVLRDLYHISFMICQYCFIYYLKDMLAVKDRFITFHIFRFCSRSPERHRGRCSRSGKRLSRR